MGTQTLPMAGIDQRRELFPCTRVESPTQIVSLRLHFLSRFVGLVSGTVSPSITPHYLSGSASFMSKSSISTAA